MNEPFILAKSFHEAVGALVARDTTCQPYTVVEMEDHGMSYMAARNALSGVVCPTELDADINALYLGKPIEVYEVGNSWEFFGVVLVLLAGEGEPPTRVWAIDC